MQSLLRNAIVATIMTTFPLIFLADARAGKLLVGAATTSITPSEPVALSGQFRTRIARSVDNPCTATALALEVREGEKVVDQAIMVSCDLVTIRGTITQDFRDHVKSKLPGFDVQKLFLSATHTHTGPVMVEGKYVLPKEGIMQPSEYVKFLFDKLGEIVVKAWEGRKPSGVNWALGHAVVGYNRRVVYADGHAQMYGKTNHPDFRSIEGYEDHGLEMLFFWNDKKKLQAIAINVACPSQEVEGLSTVNADFWHDVREQLQKKYSKDLCVLGWCGAAGDQSPHRLYRKQAEERMRRLRGVSWTQEIARRIVRAVNDVYQIVKNDIQTDVVLAHKVQTLKLPVRIVTEEECKQCQAYCDSIAKKKNPSTAEVRRARWHEAVVKRYKTQKDNPYYDAEVHVIRLGDVAIATNPFELFLDFGIQMKARSKALQTILIQLTGPGSYVPTKKAADGGGYSAIVQSNPVGHKGGKVLVDRTVEMINELWK